MWFHQEVFLHRFGCSLIWTLVLQYCFLNTILLFLSLVSWHPLHGVQAWFSVVISPFAIVLHIILGSSCSAFAFLHMNFYSVQRFIYSTRLEIIRKYASLKYAVHFLLHSILGIVTVFCYIGLLKSSTKSEDNLLRKIFTLTLHDNLFVCLHGLYAGAAFSCKYFADDRYLLVFNLAQQSKVLSAWSSVQRILSDSIQSILKSLHWYYLTYVIFGSYFVQWISRLLNLQFSLALSDTLYNVMSISMLLTTLTTGIMLYFTWSFYLCIFSLFASEKHEFLIVSSNEKSKTLCKSLLEVDCKLLQYLAFMDLRWLSQFSPTRRRNFYTISQPGGHPYLWQAVESTCTSILSRFHSNLNALRYIQKSEDFGPNATYAKPEKRYPRNQITIYLVKVQSSLRKKSLCKYFLDSLPDIEALKLFATCHLEIWIIEALGFLIASAYTEDKYGVVQESLPKILKLLIDLKLTEEKLPVGIMSFKKYAVESRSLKHGVSQRQKFKSALESALYRIVLAFKTDIRGVFLPDEYSRHLERYLEFKQ